MGVKGLWKLLDGTGRPVDLDSLEGKVLAVDISVWLNMAVKGMRDYHGHSSQTAHLVSLFNRICKLLYHGIKPVFVFDGKAPALKQKTLRERRDRKTENVRESKKANEKILQNFLKRQLLNDISDSAPKKQKERSRVKMDSGETSHKPVISIKQKPQEEDIYNLPPLSANINQSDDSELEEELSMRAELQREFYDNVTNNEFQNILDMNIESKDFNSLPSDVQYELLQDLHEVRKRQRTRIETMPEESNSFSNYQIKGLLAKRKITKKMESVETKMSQENVEASSNFFGVDRESMDDHTIVARQLVSDSKSHFIWLRKSADAKDKNEDQSKQNIRDEIATENAQEHKILLPEHLGVPVASNKKNVPTISTTNVFTRHANKSDHFENPHKSLSADPQNLDITLGESPIADIVTDSQVHNEAGSSNAIDSKCPVASNVTLHSASPQRESYDSRNLATNEIAESVMYDSVSNEQEKIKLAHGSVSNDPGQSHLPLSMPDKPPQFSEKHSLQSPAYSQFEKNILKESYSNNDTPETITLPTSKPPVLFNTGGSDGEIGSDSGDDFVDVPEEAQNGNIQSAQSSPLDSIVQVSSSAISQEDTPSTNENLWEGLNVDDVGKYTEEIDQQSKELRKLMQAKDRAAREVSQSAQSECQDLLKLFGLPYIVSPQEAEAQCAALEEIGLSNGTITDDSDIWLFGGKYVIKDMFGSGKDPVAYCLSDIETQLGLNRDRFICLALCSGSDYTPGIHGVGPVTAMEILKEFEGTGINGLVKLKQWWDNTVASTKQSSPKETKIKTQIRRVNLRKDFPSQVVYNAYTRPIVDKDNKKFEWGFPDLDELRIFATDIMGWTRQKVDEILLPVIKRQGQRRSAQSKITKFFPTSVNVIGKKKSKRVQRAALVLTGKQDLRRSSSNTKKQPTRKVNPKKKNQEAEIKLSESSSSEDD